MTDPRPTSVRSPWWEEIDAPPPRVTAPSLPVAAAPPAPAEPVTAPLPMNAVPLVASAAPQSMRSQMGDAPLQPEPVPRTVLVQEESPSSEANVPAMALLDAALASAADADSAPFVKAPAVIDEPQAPSMTNEAPQTEPQPLVGDLSPHPADHDESVPTPSEEALAPGEVAAVTVPAVASDSSSEEPVGLRSETPRATVADPFGGQGDVPKAPPTSPDFAPGSRESPPSSDVDSAPTEPDPVPSNRTAANFDSEATTVEVPTVSEAPVKDLVSRVSAPGGVQDASRPTTHAASMATPDPIGVGLVSPAAGSHGSLADTWSRFLPTPSELRSVQLPAPDGAGKATSPKSTISLSSSDDEWSGLNESDRDVAEFQSLFRARFGRTATASMDGSLRLHRPVIAFERQLAARRQLERPSDGASALVSRAADRPAGSRASEPRKPVDERPSSGDDSFGSTGVRRGTMSHGDADGLLRQTAVKLRPFRVPTPDASSSNDREPRIDASPPAARTSPPIERPLVVGEDDIPEVPSDWRPRQ